MWRTTHDEEWRDRGWEIFLAIQRICRIPTGYASVLGVNRRPGARIQLLDEMPRYNYFFCSAVPSRVFVLCYTDFHPSQRTCLLSLVVAMALLVGVDRFLHTAIPSPKHGNTSTSCSSIMIQSQWTNLSSIPRRTLCPFSNGLTGRRWITVFSDSWRSVCLCDLPKILVYRINLDRTS